MDVLMPRLSSGMEEGTVVAWLKQNGAEVAVGDEIAEIEGDKATMSIHAEADGTLHHLVEAGSSRAVGDAIAHIGDPVAAAPAPSSAPEVGEASTPGGTRAPIGTRPASRGPVASPVARRLAEHHGIDLTAITPRANARRITRADVEAAVAARDADAAGSPIAGMPEDGRGPDGNGDRSGPARRGKGPVEIVRLDASQSTIARRMAESKSQIPEFTIRMRAGMRGCVELREAARAQGLAPPSFNDFVVKASAQALKRHPRVNAAYRDGTFELYGRVNVGIAVAAEGTLLVPTIFDADRLTLAEIGADSRRLAEAARERRLTPAELGDGTFTISNLGMFGVDEFTAVINPPQAAILAVGSLRDGPQGEPVMTLTLTCDHRILYGADAAAFLADVRGLLERPLSLVL